MSVGNRSNGQGLVEYAIVVALVAMLVIGGALFVGSHVASTLQTVGNDLTVPGMSAGPTAKPTPTPKPTKTPKPTPKPKKTPKP